MSDDGAARHFSLDLKPILDSLETLICHSDSADLSADLVTQTLKNLEVFKDAASLDPHAPDLMEFYRQLGLHVTVYLTRRVAAERIATRTISSARKSDL